MSKKELKNLNRRELLQLLLIQAEENERLKKELETVKNELEYRELVMQKAGSLAEASLQLSGIFQAADEAVKQYVDSIEKMASKQEREYTTRMKDAQDTAYAILAEANAYSKRKHEEADAYFDAMKAKFETQEMQDGEE